MTVFVTCCLLSFSMWLGFLVKQVVKQYSALSISSELLPSMYTDLAEVTEYFVFPFDMASSDLSTLFSLMSVWQTVRLGDELGKVCFDSLLIEAMILSVQVGQKEILVLRLFLITSVSCICLFKYQK